MSPTVYLVTGAGRGIGYDLVKQLSEQQNVIIYAGIRGAVAEYEQLVSLIAQYPDAIFPLKITSASQEDNSAAAEYVRSKEGKVDVIIANAGRTSGVIPLAKLSAADLKEDFEVNTIGPLILFQSFASLLSAAGGAAKFVVISSVAGQLTEMPSFPIASYGISKAGANYIAKKIDQEYEDIISFPMHPGMVDTDMGRKALAHMGVKLEDIGGVTSAESAKGVLRIVQIATKESHGGRFWSNTGDLLTF